MAGARLSLSHRDDGVSPSCLPRLLLALSSNSRSLFIGWIVFVFSFFGKFLFLLLLLLDRCSSCRDLLFDWCFQLDSDAPDEAQQFASYGCHDLAAGFAGGRELHVALVQSYLCFPGYLLNWFWDPFLSLAQLWPDRRPVPITPGGFD